MNGGDRREDSEDSIGIPPSHHFCRKLVWRIDVIILDVNGLKVEGGQ